MAWSVWFETILMKVADGVLADGNGVLDGDVAGGDVGNDDAVDGLCK